MLLPLLLTCNFICHWWQIIFTVLVEVSISTRHWRYWEEGTTLIQKILGLCAASFHFGFQIYSPSIRMCFLLRDLEMVLCALYLWYFLPFGFWLGLINREHPQEMGGKQELVARLLLWLLLFGVDRAKSIFPWEAFPSPPLVSAISSSL